MMQRPLHALRSEHHARTARRRFTTLLFPTPGFERFLVQIFPNGGNSTYYLLMKSICFRPFDTVCLSFLRNWSQQRITLLCRRFCCLLCPLPRLRSSLMGNAISTRLDSTSGSVLSTTTTARPFQSISRSPTPEWSSQSQYVRGERNSFCCLRRARQNAMPSAYE